jgi:hypothetical protein
LIDSTASGFSAALFLNAWLDKTLGRIQAQMIYALQRQRKPYTSSIYPNGSTLQLTTIAKTLGINTLLNSFSNGDSADAHQC